VLGRVVALRQWLLFATFRIGTAICIGNTMTSIDFEFIFFSHFIQDLLSSEKDDYSKTLHIPKRKHWICQSIPNSL